MMNVSLILVRHGEDEDNANHIINGHRETSLTVLLVAHFEIGKVIEAAYYDWSWQQALKTPYFKNGGTVFFKK